MFRKVLITLVVALGCCLLAVSACPAQNLTLTPAEEAQVLEEPHITAAEVDLFIKTMPRLMKAVNETETLAITKEIGWSNVRMVAVSSKIVMAYTYLTNPEVYTFLVDAELFGKGFEPGEDEIALVKGRMAEFETLFAEDGPETD